MCWYISQGFYNGRIIRQKSNFYLICVLINGYLKIKLCVQRRDQSMDTGAYAPNKFWVPPLRWKGERKFKDFAPNEIDSGHATV